MAGYFTLNTTFDFESYGDIVNAGFGVRPLLDLTHCANTTTTDHRGTQVMQKGIELDVEISTGTLTADTYADLLADKDNQTAAVKELLTKLEEWGGWEKLSGQHAKVEFSSIATEVFDPTSPSGATQGATYAATAADANAYNALPDWCRKAHGMFKFDNWQWVRETPEEPAPRRAP